MRPTVPAPQPLSSNNERPLDYVPCTNIENMGRPTEHPDQSNHSEVLFTHLIGSNGAALSSQTKEYGTVNSPVIGRSDVYSRIPARINYTPSVVNNNVPPNNAYTEFGSTVPSGVAAVENGQHCLGTINQPESMSCQGYNPTPMEYFYNGSFAGLEGGGQSDQAISDHVNQFMQTSQFGMLCPPATFKILLLLIFVISR